MRKLKEFGALTILGGLTLVIAVAWTITTYLVDEDTLRPPLAILLQIAYIAAIVGAFWLLRMKFDRLKEGRSGKGLGRPDEESALEPADKLPER